MLCVEKRALPANFLYCYTTLSVWARTCQQRCAPPYGVHSQRRTRQGKGAEGRTTRPIRDAFADSIRSLAGPAAMAVMKGADGRAVRLLASLMSLCHRTPPPPPPPPLRHKQAFLRLSC